MSTRSYFFIINPKSGNGRGLDLVNQIENKCRQKQVKFAICVTQKAKEGTEIAKKAIQDGFSIIIAVGGDGTVNEVGSAVVHSNAALGIIPIGSGNGLAREMKIPLDHKTALRTIFEGNIKKIDTGTCNGKYFACTAGIGFDAHMAEKFLHLEKRGLTGYVKVFLKEFFGYKEQEFEITANGRTEKTKAFMITIANCRQWGNDFFISPTSKPTDGTMELCLLGKFNLLLFPVLLYRLLIKTMHHSHNVNTIRSNVFIILSDNEFYYHHDGEISGPESKVIISVLPNSLNILN